MNPCSRQWISRKEIADITGLSVDCIRRSEAHLGLDRIKVEVNQRTILFPREKALAIVNRRILRRPRLIKTFADRLASLQMLHAQ